MSNELNKPNQYWIYKGTSNFCNEPDYDIETDSLVKRRPDGFYDIVSTKDTIEGGIHVIEIIQFIKLQEENERLKNIISRELSENDEYGMEYTGIVLLKEENKILNEKLIIAIEALEDIRRNYRHCDTNHSDTADNALNEIKEK